MSAFETIAAAGGQLVSPDTVLPASIPLELSGEVVRGRICTFVDDAGQEWALRPDLTLPVALLEIAERRDALSGESRRYYRGPVFRMPSLESEPLEFEQIGIERFGAARDVSVDAELYEIVCAACTAEAVTAGKSTFGDLALFPSLIDALGLPADLTAGLKRAFRQEGGIKAFLDAESNGAAAGLGKRFAGLSKPEIAAAVEDVFAMTGVRPVGERSTEEIVERLAERAAAPIGDMLSEEQRRGLESLLALETPLDEAADRLAELAMALGVPGDVPAIVSLRQRTDVIAKTAPAGFLKDARFLTQFGRRFTYYDGFVFEISRIGDPQGARRPFASGGRYDSLLQGLSGGDVDATALGGVVVPHRLRAAKEALA